MRELGARPPRCSAARTSLPDARRLFHSCGHNTPIAARARWRIAAAVVAPASPRSHMGCLATCRRQLAMKRLDTRGYATTCCSPRSMPGAVALALYRVIACAIVIAATAYSWAAVPRGVIRILTLTGWGLLAAALYFLLAALAPVVDGPTALVAVPTAPAIGMAGQDVQVAASVARAGGTAALVEAAAGDPATAPAAPAPTAAPVAPTVVPPAVQPPTIAPVAAPPAAAQGACMR